MTSNDEWKRWATMDDDSEHGEVKWDTTLGFERGENVLVKGVWKRENVLVKLYGF